MPEKETGKETNHPSPAFPFEGWREAESRAGLWREQRLLCSAASVEGGSALASFLIGTHWGTPGRL